jgi:hypothetical protein
MNATSTLAPIQCEIFFILQWTNSRKLGTGSFHFASLNSIMDIFTNRNKLRKLSMNQKNNFIIFLQTLYTKVLVYMESKEVFKQYA